MATTDSKAAPSARVEDSSIQIAEFEPTPLGDIATKASIARQTFASHKTKDLEWRLVQLRKLYWGLTDYGAQLSEALRRDLRKSQLEAAMTEIDWVKNDCLYMIQHLKTFANDKKLKSPDVPMAYYPMRFRLRKEPLGSVCIIGAYNFPVNLLLSPFVGAIAAGCTAVIKPSELSPASAMVITEMIRERLDRDAFHVVNGAVAETTALLDEKWDKILYTGSATVGTIIAKKAAETLTPVCLELGGRNPAFVTRHANLPLAARRLLWGKSFNAGQICMSQNYVLVEKDVLDTFIVHLNNAHRDFFPNGAKASPDLARIVNLRHFRRIKRMLDSTRGKVVMGGQHDEAELFIEPTVVLVDSVDDAMMTEESFGPIFAIMAVDSLDEALRTSNQVDRTPLALFSFGSKAENARVLNEMTSGGATLNDSCFHGAVNTVPFGGVGTSGTGCYHGRFSFDCFSHQRTVAETPSWFEPLLRVRYMPYDVRRYYQMQRMMWPANPGFDRDGRVTKRGLGYWLLFLPGMSR